VIDDGSASAFCPATIPAVHCRCFYCIGKKLLHPSMPQLFLKREKYEKIYDYQKQLLLF